MNENSQHTRKFPRHWRRALPRNFENMQVSNHCKPPSVGSGILGQLWCILNFSGETANPCVLACPNLISSVRFWVSKPGLRVRVLASHNSILVKFSWGSGQQGPSLWQGPHDRNLVRVLDPPATLAWSTSVVANSRSWLWQQRQPVPSISNWCGEERGRRCHKPVGVMSSYSRGQLQAGMKYSPLLHIDRHRHVERGSAMLPETNLGDRHQDQYFSLGTGLTRNFGIQGPDLQNILRQSYDYLTIMPKLRSTYDGRLTYKASYDYRKINLW